MKRAETDHVWETSQKAASCVDRPAGRRGWSLVAIILSLTILLASCSPATDDRFPTLPTQSTTATKVTPKPTDGLNPQTPVTLRVAGPFTAEAAEALRQLYLNLEYGQLVRKDGTTIGDTFRPGSATPNDASLQIRFEPVTMEQIMDGSTYKAMAEAGTLPDVFATGDVGSLLKMGALADMTPVLSSIDTKAASRMPIFAMDALRSKDRYWGVPYLATVPVLLANASLTGTLNTVLPAERMSAAGMTELMIRAYHQLQILSRPAATPTPPEDNPAVSPTPAIVDNPYATVSVIADLRPMLRYWPASVDESLGFAAYQDETFRFESAAVTNTLKLLRALDRPQMTPNGSMAMAGPVNIEAARSLFRNNKAAYLIDDSSRLQAWSLQSSVRVQACDLPVGDLAKALKTATNPWPTTFPNPTTAPVAAGPTPAVVDPATLRQAFNLSAYCVSATSAHPAIAAKIAYFLAQDPDALLLQNQYVRYEGYLPLSHDKNVWEKLVGAQSSDTLLSGGPLLYPYQVRLRWGYANPSILLPGFEPVVAGTLQSPERFQPGASTSATVLTALSKTALERLQEDLR